MSLSNQLAAPAAPDFPASEWLDSIDPDVSTEIPRVLQLVANFGKLSIDSFDFDMSLESTWDI